ncbi:MAG: dienelactone hydrolase [Acidimicrobiales bacterium]
MPLSDYRTESFTHGGVTHEVFHRGEGPCVLVAAEIPGITPEVIRFADDLHDLGFSVAMPSMFGTPGREPTPGHALRTIAKACIGREFQAMATRDASPATDWLRALARGSTPATAARASDSWACASPVASASRCFSTAVIAPVLSQPSLPFGVGKRRKASVGLDDVQLRAVAEQAAEGCSVLGLRFTGDALVPAARFETLRDVLGDNFVGVEIQSPDPAHGIGKMAHSVLTEERSAEPGHPTKDAYDQVVAFLSERLERR